jgi:CDP-paratose 2-epimerase
MSKKLIVTGSMGLIGSEVAEYFLEKGWEVYGIDNNQRAIFFGLQGDNSLNKDRLAKYGSSYKLYTNIDIRDRESILNIIPLISLNVISNISIPSLFRLYALSTHLTILRIKSLSLSFIS